MIQIEFANKAKSILEKEENVIGFAAGGSWITNEIDNFSDLDLVIVTKNKITDDKNKMLTFARKFDNFLSGFTGEHVGEPRLLICLYDNPLLHVDFKFVTLEEFKNRIETPVILLDKNGQLQNIINNTEPKFPYPNYQWIEDRFWIWIHYILMKIGRGEFLEAFDGFGFLRMTVLGPLLHIKDKNLPRGVRKVETELNKINLEKLLKTIPSYDRQSLLNTLHHVVELYRELRNELFDNSVLLQKETEEKVMIYFQQLN